RVEQRLRVGYGGGTGGNGGIGAGGKQVGHGIDDVRVDERFVALHIHHDGVIGQAQQGSGLGEAVGAGGVVGSREQGLEAMCLNGSCDGVVVGGHHHARRI